ncbi:hypothetical protein [Archangium lipolyticum]|uniref:hypothetical protein n=1 Tax=Archangium lipolyticum TaxID=2970465 RepID=UPI00214A66F6|nr:hypothetical protein [Archangium lipolyticum]
MKMTSKLVVSCVSAMAFVAAWLPAAASAADDERNASSANVCSVASVEEGEAQDSHAEQSESQSTGSSLAGGYCYLDCSRCDTNQDCWSRGAGSCTSIKLCVQSEPLATMK